MKPSESAQGLTVIWVVDVFNEKMLVEGMSRVLNEINFRTIYSKDFCLLHQNKQIRLISNHGWALKTLIHIGYIHYGVGTKTIVNWSKGMIQVSRLSQISSKGIILSVKLDFLGRKITYWEVYSSLFRKIVSNWRLYGQNWFP